MSKCIAYLIIILSLDIHFTMGKSLNVGTVLFHESDASKMCWTDESIALLTSRYIMQELIPLSLINVNSDEYIRIYLSYVNKCLEHTRRTTAGVVQQLLVLAMADTVGGYLKSYMLPVTKHAFYAGNIRYGEAKRLFSLYEEIRALLKTDGSKWKKPMQMSQLHFKIHPLQIIPPTRGSDPCNDFITYQKNGKNEKNPARANIVIPIPFLDDSKSPSSIAVPLKTLSLHSLDAPASQFLVVKYYIASTKCLISREVPNQEIMNFNRRFKSWLLQSVIPHLKDTKWYPAFGGVLKILETMKRLGVNELEFGHPEPDDCLDENKDLFRNSLDGSRASPREYQVIKSSKSDNKHYPDHTEDDRSTLPSNDQDSSHTVGNIAVFRSNAQEARHFDYKETHGDGKLLSNKTIGYLAVALISVVIFWLCAGLLFLVMYYFIKRNPESSGEERSVEEGERKPERSQHEQFSRGEKEREKVVGPTTPKG